MIGVAVVLLLLAGAWLWNARADQLPGFSARRARRAERVDLTGEVDAWVARFHEDYDAHVEHRRNLAILAERAEQYPMRVRPQPPVPGEPWAAADQTPSLVEESESDA